MNNYFETQRIHWHNFAPENIIFKSNNITKKLMPEANVISYKSKTDRDDQMAVKTGSNQVTNNWGHTYYKAINHVAVHVRLKDVKKDFVTADVDFVDLREKKDSQGGHCGGINVLVYIQSYHDKYDYKKNAQGNWAMVKKNPQSLPDDDPKGYMIAYGGQGDSNPMEHCELREIIDVAEAVRQFLINRVLPFKRGEFAEKDLTLIGQYAIV